jgi:hypothetical protein
MSWLRHFLREFSLLFYRNIMPNGTFKPILQSQKWRSHDISVVEYCKSEQKWRSHDISIFVCNLSRNFKQITPI